jgi:hypothetical protein
VQSDHSAHHLLFYLLLFRARSIVPSGAIVCIHGTSLAGGADGCCYTVVSQPGREDSKCTVTVTCMRLLARAVVPLPLSCCLRSPRDTITWYGALRVRIVVGALAAQPAADDLSGPLTVLVVGFGGVLLV